MRTLVLFGSNVEEIEKSYEAHFLQVDAFEVRLDLIGVVSYQALKRFREKVVKPLIFTLKGPLLKKEEAFSYLALNPTYCDLPEDFPSFSLMKKQFPHIKWILSYHNLQEVPSNIEEIVFHMRQKGADILKIACQVKTPLEGLQLISLAKSISAKKVVIGMGKRGRWLRSISSFLENYFHYLAKDKKAAFLGQYTVKEWSRFSRVDKNTSLYALLGDPVWKSKGDLFHNKAFIENRENSLYLKIRCQKKELLPFLQEAKCCFLGFSITRPLKEEAALFCKIETPINTLARKEENFMGYNTDVEAAMTLFATVKKASKVVILGTGGASIALGEAFFMQNKSVYFIGRNQEALQRLQKRGFFTFSFAELSSLDLGENVFFVQATPIHTLLFEEKILRPSWTVLDLIYVPEKTALFQAAKRRGCKVFSGKEFFRIQAEKQQQIWRKEKVS